MKNEKLRAQLAAIVADLEANPLVKVADDPGDCEAYEILRRIKRQLEREQLAICRRVEALGEG